MTTPAVKGQVGEAEGLLGAGKRAIRQYARPFLLIQAAAVGLVVAYQASATVRAACATLAEVKRAGGLPFSAAAAAVAGGLLPEVAKLVAAPRRGLLRGRGGEVAFNTVFFALNGVVVDLFYRLATVLFGAVATPGTVVEKVAFDQFVFSPTWLYVIVVLFTWRQNHFSFAATRAAVDRRFYRRRVLPLLLPNWCFWMPMTSIIYALPANLQFLLFVLALAAWSLIMVFIAAGAGP